MRIFLLIFCLMLPSFAYDSLYTACNRGRLDDVIRFIKAGHDVNHTSGYSKQTPIFGIRTNSSDIPAVTDSILTLLLENGADINVADKHGYTPLHKFVQSSRSRRFAIRLVEAGANINAQSNNGTTPLYNAMSSYSNRNSEMVTFLIEKGADITLKSYGGKNLMHYAAEYKNEFITQLLSAGGEELLSQQDDSGRVPLYYALRNHSYESLPVMALMSEGVDMSVVDKRNMTLMDALLYRRGMKKNRAESVKILLEAGVPPNSVPIYRGFTAYQNLYHLYNYDKNAGKNRKEEAKAICEILELSGYDFSEERKGVAKQFGMDILNATMETLYVVGKVLLIFLPYLVVFLIIHILVYKKNEKNRAVLISIAGTFSLILIFFALGVGVGILGVMGSSSFMFLLVAPLAGALLGLITGIVLAVNKVYFRPLYYISPVGVGLISWGVFALTSWSLF